jgi:SOS response regulatory protein OraA/RecX
MRSALLLHGISLLSGRAHSRVELERKLTSLLCRRRLPQEEALPLVKSVSAELLERGLLDDEAYAAWHAAQRDAVAGTRRPRSRAQLAGELFAKGLPRAAVQGAVAGHCELASCAAAALRRPALRGAQLVSHLKFKGFQFWAVARVAHARDESEDALRALLEAERAGAAAAATAEQEAPRLQ